MAAVALLRRTSNPTDEEIDAIENVCRCGSYFRIREAIKAAGAAMSKQVTAPGSGAAAPVSTDVQLPATGGGAAVATAGAAAVAAAMAARLLQSGAVEPA
jgi:xanthine dehydrogenase iron-sulfur cluster and FAD-binding subunit A